MHGLIVGLTLNFAVDVHPEEDWESVAAHLDGLQAEGALSWIEASALPIAASRHPPG